jgi:hypothetical protein
MRSPAEEHAREFWISTRTLLKAADDDLPDSRATSLAVEAQRGIGQRRQALGVDLSPTFLAGAVRSPVKPTDRMLHLAQRALQVLAESQLSSLLESYSRVIGHVIAISQPLLTLNR